MEPLAPSGSFAEDESFGTRDSSSIDATYSTPSTVWIQRTAIATGLPNVITVTSEASRSEATENLSSSIGIPIPISRTHPGVEAVPEISWIQAPILSNHNSTVQDDAKLADLSADGEDWMQRNIDNIRHHHNNITNNKNNSLAAEAAAAAANATTRHNVTTLFLIVTAPPTTTTLRTTIQPSSMTNTAPVANSYAEDTTSASSIQENDFGVPLLATLALLYLLTACLVGGVLTRWHVQYRYRDNDNIRSQAFRFKKHILWFPPFLLLGVALAPPVSFWGTVQMIVFIGLLAVKACFRVEVRWGTRWVFGVPPIYLRDGMFPPRRPRRVVLLRR